MHEAKPGALSCLLIHSCSAMDRHMQHSVFYTIAFLAFSCLAFSTPATWCRIFMSRIFSIALITLTTLELWMTALTEPAIHNKRLFSQNWCSNSYDFLLTSCKTLSVSQLCVAPDLDHLSLQEAQLSPRHHVMRRVSWNLWIATKQCRNYLYDKSWTNRSHEVRALQ